MRLIKTVFLIFCVSFLFFISAIAQAEESIIVNHRVVDSVIVEEGSDVTLEMYLTNTGASTLSDVKLFTGEHISFIPYDDYLYIDSLYAGVESVVNWNVLSLAKADYIEIAEYLSAPMILHVEAVNEFGETVHFITISKEFVE